MRRSSIILGIAAVTLPFACAYLSTSAYYERAAADGVYVCGLQALAAVVFACIASSLISAVSVTLGTVAYLRLPSPRPLRRRFELASLSLPLLLCGTYPALLLFS
jgi:hypothetical protein